MNHLEKNWRFCIDRGGTFTDVIGIYGDKIEYCEKLLSESTQYDDAVFEGIRRALCQKGEDASSARNISFIRVGATVATNAMLERKGEPTTLVITEGFGDLLEIGYQDRPDIFALCIQKPRQLYTRVATVEERIDAFGRILRPLNREKLKNDLRALFDSGIRSVAIAFLHSWKNPAHEKQAAKIAQQIGFTQVSLSSEVMPLIKIVRRGQTTLVDSYLNPVLKAYTDKLRSKIKNSRFWFMKSSGGLTEPESFSGKDAIFSGPAGGVVGCAAVAGQNDLNEVIGFDMGGTSTDICRYGGSLERADCADVGGIKFTSEMLDVKTIASGGGSILSFENGKFTVGPQSAGARPGPACYGFGGPLTITDANLLTGRIIPERFPATFGAGGDRALDRDQSLKRFAAISKAINESAPEKLSTEHIALGFLRVANEKMSSAIKETALSKGRDVRTHALIAFGGAAPQHACAVAEILGMETVVVPRLSGLLSAYGIAVSNHTKTAQKAVMEIFSQESNGAYENDYEQMAAPLIEELNSSEKTRESISIKRSLDLRPAGSDSFLNVPFASYTRILESFHCEYKNRFGFVADDVKLETVALRVEVIAYASLQDAMDEKQSSHAPSKNPSPIQLIKAWFTGGPMDTPVFERNSLRGGDRVSGPAVIVEDHATTLVEPGFTARINSNGHIVMSLTRPRVEQSSTRRDPVMLEVFNNLFTSIAKQMGLTLKKTAFSTNIKERLDFSCAVFDNLGNLAANAPHIPVHLGAMGDTVRSVSAEHGQSMRPGDVYLSNDPAAGGSHLPDLTVVSPIFNDQGRLLFFVANRGHHADIGGKWPGSMSPEAKTLREEGVMISNMLIVRYGVFLENGVRRALASGPWPARNIPERLADLRAQIAANNFGSKELLSLVDKYGMAVTQAYMGHMQRNAAEAMEKSLDDFLDGREVFESEFCDQMDDGAKLCVRVTIRRRSGETGEKRAVLDFSGTSRQKSDNFNAPVAVTKAAVIYVFRTMIDTDIPLNEGCLEPIEIIIPRGCMLNPAPDAAVSAGNVETSQRIVDVLYGALGIAAASQGTMNNFLFGRSDQAGDQYYETIAGGAGAKEGCDGASAVHTHMTNTRITDPEVLEYRFPWVLLKDFSIRRDSGGKGRFCGGNGVRREFEFQEKCQINIISQRRTKAPYGLEGGKNGMPGINLLIDEKGSEMQLGSTACVKVDPGQKIVIKTPGGGGFGIEEKKIS